MNDDCNHYTFDFDRVPEELLETWIQFQWEKLWFETGLIFALVAIIIGFVLYMCHSEN